MAAAPAVSFFAQQERARSASRTLVVLYAFAALKIKLEEKTLIFYL